jgi:hypothetical protein
VPPIAGAAQPPSGRPPLLAPASSAPAEPSLEAPPAADAGEPAPTPVASPETTGEATLQPAASETLDSHQPAEASSPAGSGKPSEPAEPVSTPALLESSEETPPEAEEEPALLFPASHKGLLARAKRRTGRLPPLDGVDAKDVPRIGDSVDGIANDDISSVARLMGASRFRDLVSHADDPLNPALLPEALLEDLPDETRQLLAQVRPPQLSPSATSGRSGKQPSLRQGLPPLRQTREFITGVLRSIGDRIIEDPPRPRKHTAPFNRPLTPPKPEPGKPAAPAGVPQDAASPPAKARVCPKCKAVVPGPDTHCPRCKAAVPPAPIGS